MGCFDTITFDCPDCGKELMAQSKSGDCDLAYYSHTDVPVAVALDANRHSPFKCECGASWELGNLPEQETVALSVIKVVE